jgi:hypothetical protein
MRLHKLLISVMFLGLLLLLAVPFLTVTKSYSDSQCALEPSDGSIASMHDIAAPGLQVFELKTRSSGNFAPGLDAANSRLASITSDVETGKVTQSWAIEQISQSKPLWLINQSLLI